MGSYALNWNSNGRDRLTAEDRTRIGQAFNAGDVECPLPGQRVAYLDEDNTSVKVKHPDTVHHSLVGSLDYVVGENEEVIDLDEDDAS